MQLSKSVKRHLVGELQFAAEKMKREEDPFRKLYFFSAFFGEASRALNWGWDRELVLIHSVCQNTYQQIYARLQSIISGQEKAARPPAALLEKLVDVAQELADYIDKNKDSDQESLMEILGRLAELGYVTTGNGVYLYERGSIKI